MKLLFSALSKFLIGLLFVGALLFLPGGFGFFNAWLFIALLFVPVFILGVVLFIKSPSLLEKRINAKEKENTQKGVLLVAALIFIFGFIVAGLDFRYSLSYVPSWLVVVASIVFLLSYVIYAEVLRENAYLSRVIEVQENQKVVDTGLYSIVCHPMYAVTIWLFFSIPLILGSWWSLLCFSPYVVIIAIRIINEEKVLESGLDGYSEYKKRVKYRIIPFVW